MTTEGRSITGRDSDRQVKPNIGGTRGRIVVGIDGSGASRNALRTAFLEAVRRGANLEVVCTYGDVVWTGEAATDGRDLRAARADTAAHTRTFIEEVRNELLVEDMNGLGNVSVRRLIDRGAPAPVLVRRAEDAELLVVGSRGRGAMTSALLGSVALHCVTEASCPVLVVHGHAQVHPPASAAVVVGVDGSAVSVCALREAVAHAARLGCGVEVVAVHVQEHFWDDRYTVDPPSMEQFHPKMREHAERAVDLVAAVLSSCPGTTVPPVYVAVAEGSAAEVLIERSADAAMLVVGSWGHGLVRGLMLGSVALHCVIHARCSVMVVPPEHEPAAAAGRRRAPAGAPR